MWIMLCYVCGPYLKFSEEQQPLSSFSEIHLHEVHDPKTTGSNSKLLDLQASIANMTKEHENMTPEFM